MRAFWGLHLVVVIGNALVFFERLRAKLNAVNKKDNLVGILGVGNKLRRLEDCHGFAGTGGVPDVAAALFFFSPLRFCYAVRDGAWA